MKKFMKSALAILAMLSITSLSFAAVTVDVKVTSEPVVPASESYKSGGFTLEYPAGSVITGGDTITIDLDFPATLARTIDMRIGVALDVDNAGTGVGPIGTQLLAVPADNEAITNEEGLGVTYVAGAPVGTGIYFTLKGTAGSGRLTLKAVDSAGATDSTLTFSAAAVTPLVMKFLQQTDYTAAVATDIVIAEALDADGIYDDYVDDLENAICVDFSEFHATDQTLKLQANVNSVGDIYTFNPSNPQVAHPASLVSLETYACAKANMEKIVYPGVAGQDEVITGDPIWNTFANGVGAADSTGYCDDDDQFSPILLRNADASALPGSNYKVTMEVLVNGAIGNNGVYFTDADLILNTYVAQGDACDATAAADGTDTIAPAAINYYEADGTAVAAAALTANAVYDYTVADTALAVKAEMQGYSSFGWTDSGEKYLEVEVPALVFDSELVQEGDTIGVRIYLQEEGVPCSEATYYDYTIGVVGCDAAAAATTDALFPYFGKTGAYANVMTLTNTSAGEGSADLTLYQNDGSMFTATVTVPANSVFVSLINAIEWTQVSGTTDVGADRGYVEVEADFGVTGVALITNASTGESISYIAQ